MTPNTPTNAAENKKARDLQLSKRQQDEQRVAHQDDERRHSLNEVATAIEKSKPAMLLKHLHGANVPAYDGSSVETQAECAKQDTEIAAVATKLQSGLRELKKSLAAATESGNYGDVLVAVEGVKIDHVSLGQKIVAIWSNAVNIATKMESELHPLGPQLTAEFEAVVDEVKKDLTKIGSGIESTIAYGKNQIAAEHQFRFLAMQNARSRKASNAMQNAIGNYRTVSQRRATAIQGLRAAEDYLHGIVLKQLSS